MKKSNPYPQKRKRHKSNIEKALEDVKAGRVYEAKSVDDLFEKLNR